MPALAKQTIAHEQKPSNIKDIKNRAIVEQLNLLSKMQKYCYPLELNFNLIST